MKENKLLVSYINHIELVFNTYLLIELEHRNSRSHFNSEIAFVLCRLESILQSTAKIMHISKNIQQDLLVFLV